MNMEEGIIQFIEYPFKSCLDRIDSKTKSPANSTLRDSK